MNYVRGTCAVDTKLASVPREQSYFWSCLTLSDDCLLKSTQDPKLIYFGIGVLGLYLAFLIMVGADLSFFWSLDNFQGQIDYYINMVRKKVRHVQMDQRRLMSTRERTEKQLKRTEQCKQVVTALRGAIASGDPQKLKDLTSYSLEATQNSPPVGVWHVSSK